MIRRFETADLNEIMSLWLEINIRVHYFIGEDYWKSNFNAVREMIPKAEVFVSENDGKINGFIGLEDNYIAGIFVADGDRKKGIGTQLLNEAKQRNQVLSLRVYKNNESAILFYQKAGFKIISEGIDESTSQGEYVMGWKG